MTFADKVIVITGASEGIGAELARQLAPERPKLVLAARRLERLEQVAAQVQALGGQALALRVDVCQSQDIQGMLQAPIRRGGKVGNRPSAQSLLCGHATGHRALRGRGQQD